LISAATVHNPYFVRSRPAIIFQATSLVLRSNRPVVRRRAVVVVKITIIECEPIHTVADLIGFNIYSRSWLVSQNIAGEVAGLVEQATAKDELVEAARACPELADGATLAPVAREATVLDHAISVP